MEQKFNLEKDLLDSAIMCDKCESIHYAQALYAALCNTDWIKLDTMNVLKGEYWYCSWRHAGYIVSEMRGKGDYMDFYCTGIASGIGDGIVEGTVTAEIQQDLKDLGWVQYRPILII